MSKVFINESSLTSIGNAIREKTGKTDLIAVRDMPTEIASITTGGGGEIEPIVLSGDCKYACCSNVASAYIEKFGNTVSTSGIFDSHYMFYNSTVKKIPFALNYNNSTDRNMSFMFYNAQYLEEITTMNNVKPNDLNSFLSACFRLRNLPDNFGADWDWNRINTYKYAPINSIFKNNYSLRSIPDSFLSNLWGIQTSTSNTLYYYGFFGCFVLDELKGLKVPKSDFTSNYFADSFVNCSRVKDILFALEENGSVQIANHKSQTIDLSKYVGYRDSNSLFLSYNSGITADKEVKNDATYQALKDNPDWFASDIKYSRYNHDSAVRTINSLPDTSAYLATAGGTNTIKFKGSAGSATDGGAINTLTEEEIAVATAKGWTVSFV